MKEETMLLLFLSLIFWHCDCAITTTAVAAPKSENQQEHDEIIITDFDRPEDFYDLQGTPYILVSEYNEASRTISTTIALLDTITNQRVNLSFVANNNNVIISPSIFANPSCIALPFELLGAHGLNARPLLNNENGVVLSGFWEVAVVNHYRRESIEFYALNPTTRTVSPMGCVDLTSSGESHDSVNFAPDGINLLAVTLFYKTFYGIKGQIAFVSSFLRPGLSGDGALLLVHPGGDFSILKDNLNGPNGVWFANDKQIFVAQTPNEQVRVVDPEESDEFDKSKNTAIVLSVRSSPDNLIRFSDVEFLVTRVDSPFPKIALCFLLGNCSFDFSVLRYNIETQKTEVIYRRAAGKASDDSSTTFIGQPSVAIIKNGFLYIGNFQTNNLLRVKINV